MARPRIEIDWSDFDKLCVMQATLEEIASWFGCSVDTIERAVKRKAKMGFAEYFTQKAGRGRVSLRRKQYEMALAGDRTMLIWLGKQYLKQTETVVSKFESPLELTYETKWRGPVKSIGSEEDPDKDA